MHILLTNDDGPPSPSASPYIATFMRVLTSPPFNHTVSVVVPSQQRSWIGKAHLLPPSTFPINGQLKSANDNINDVVTPTYYDPTTGDSSPSPPGPDQKDYWVTAPGTPATCVQLALFHHELLFPHLQSKSTNGYVRNHTNGINNNNDSATPAMHDASRSPFDLIISGPNYGRNTTAAFALSSGTIGGALEGAVCGVRAVALSFAFFTRQETDAMVEEASAVSVRLIERLWQDWEANATTNGTGALELHDVPDLYSINVPLISGISKTPMYWTWMLPNQWSTGSLYKAVESEESSDDEAKAVAPSFRWAPNFGDVWKTVDSSAHGNDGRVIREKCVSVTPLKANFQSLFGVGAFRGEVKI